MCIPKVAPFTSFQMAADATAYRTRSTGPVLLAYGSSNLRISGFFRNVLGNAAIKPRYRKIAVRPEAPQEAAWTEGTQYTGAGTGFSEDFSLSGLGAFLFVQPAIGGAVTAGSNGEGLVGWTAQVSANAALVARQTVLVNPDTNTGKTAIIPLGNPFPALGLAGIMGAVAARGCSGSPAVNLVARTFEGDPTIPSSWGSDLIGGGAYTFTGTNEDYNTGDLTYAPSDVALAQIGLKLPAADAQGTFDVILAARYT